MTNSLAIFLLSVVALFVVGDALLFDWENSIFLAQKFAGVLRWMAFWR